MKLNKPTKIILIVLSVILVPIAIALFALSSLFDGLCGNKIMNEVTSPNKELKAVLFSRDCGATTAYSYHVSVINQWQSISNNDGGNVFVSNSEPIIKWKDNCTLQIDRAAEDTIFKQDAKVTVWPLFKAVKIEYVN